MEKEGVERDIRQTSKKTRLIASILVEVALVVAGFVLIFVSTVP